MVRGCQVVWSEEEGVLRRESRNLLKGEESKEVKCWWVLLRFLLCVEGMFKVCNLHCVALLGGVDFLYLNLRLGKKMHYLFWGLAHLSETLGIFWVFFCCWCVELESLFLFLFYGVEICLFRNQKEIFLKNLGWFSGFFWWKHLFRWRGLSHSLYTTVEWGCSLVWLCFAWNGWLLNIKLGQWAHKGEGFFFFFLCAHCFVLCHHCIFDCWHLCVC